MSAPTNRQNANPSGRKQRHKKASQRLSDIIDSGQITAGIVDPTTPDVTPEKTTAAIATAPSSAEMASRKPAVKRTGPADTMSASRPAKVPDVINVDGQFIKVPEMNDPELIYDWGMAKPPLDPTSGSFPPLSDRHRQWKNNYDEAIKPYMGVTAPLDEWENFSGSRNLVPQIFVTRAKRAFWAGKSWEQYERQELQAYCPEFELSKTFRLAIFEKLKVRLCEEIWLQPYQERPLDSKIPTPEADEMHNRSRGSTYFAPRPFKRQRTEEEARPSPTGWAADSQGEMQPLYENETEPPSMDRHLAAFRRDRNYDVDRLQRDARNLRDLAEQLRSAHVSGITVSGRPAEMPSFEESLELNQRDMETSDEGE